MFKIATEKTSSEASGLNCFIWKALSMSNYMSSFLCILGSLSYMYGFVNVHWTNMTDVMLKKKKGARKIHVLCIIGLVCPEFNATLKYLIGHLAQKNFEKSGPCDKQHVYRPM